MLPYVRALLLGAVSGILSGWLSDPPLGLLLPGVLFGVALLLGGLDAGEPSTRFVAYHRIKVLVATILAWFIAWVTGAVFLLLISGNGSTISQYTAVMTAGGVGATLLLLLLRLLSDIRYPLYAWCLVIGFSAVLGYSSSFIFAFQKQHNLPDPFVTVLLLGVWQSVMCPALVALRRLRPSRVHYLLLIAACLVVVAFLYQATEPERLVSSTRRAIEDHPTQARLLEGLQQPRSDPLKEGQHSPGYY